jgi:hypothetical protein
MCKTTGAMRIAGRKGRGSEFARKYRVHRFVHVEAFQTHRGDHPREVTEEMKAGLENSAHWNR